MLQLISSEQIAQAQYAERLASAAHSRSAAHAAHSRRTIAHGAARVLGRALLRLSVGLLRYGRDESPVTMPLYRASAGTLRLN